MRLLKREEIVWTKLEKKHRKAITGVLFEAAPLGRTFTQLLGATKMTKPTLSKYLQNLQSFGWIAKYYDSKMDRIEYRLNRRVLKNKDNLIQIEFANAPKLMTRNIEDFSDRAFLEEFVTKIGIATVFTMLHSFSVNTDKSEMWLGLLDDQKTAWKDALSDRALGLTITKLAEKVAKAAKSGATLELVIPRGRLAKLSQLLKQLYSTEVNLLEDIVTGVYLEKRYGIT